MSAQKLLIYATGIFVCYFCYGILQERITRGVYGSGENAEKFTYSFALVFFQCAVNCLFAKGILSFSRNGQQSEDSTRTFYYAFAALTYLLAMVCSNMALQFVSYPTQVVGKAGKPIPVMILGVLLGNKSYPLKKYLFVLLVVIGVALFMYKDGVKENNQKNSTGFGQMLILLSLLMDGLISATQERMKSEHNTKSGPMMYNMNLWSTIYSVVIIIISGELGQFLGFLQRHPSSIWQILIFSITSALGQYFIFLIITDFGPLPCSIVTTTRKFFSVLLSVLLFGNSLIGRQWLATCLVFSGLLLDAYYSKRSASSKKVVVK